MMVFYVHDESDQVDVVLRSQVANTIFIFLPKVLIVLFKTSMKDDKVGETIKSVSFSMVLYNFIYIDLNIIIRWQFKRWDALFA